ncbi:MAG TPA: histidine kinase [Candidatus Acidoferrales bacterium]|nr:histidine kinase [Candidatus Acidoferrales bacterium]
MKPAPLLGRRAAIAVVVAVYTAIGLLLTSYRYLENVANRQYGTLLPRFLEEMTGAYTALIGVPIAVYAARRFPISRTTWKTGIPVAVLAAIAYSAIHTTLMWATRSALFPLAGLGPYDYGIMLFRYPMEASNDVISFAFVSGFVYAWDRLAAARRTELASAELQTKLARAQLENLRLQLNPHFLFNTLNAISAVMYEDVGKADAMLTKLSDFLRVVLDSHGVHQVPIGDELAVERKYVEIMTSRLEQRLELKVRVEAGASDAAVPFMILQPLLENCIRHGVSSERGAIEIEIEVSRRNGSTVIAVVDDGVGFAARAAGGGRGLRLVTSRLEHLYGDAATFAIGGRETGGTRAEMTLPFVRMESA